MRLLQLVSFLCLSTFSTAILHAQDGTPLQKAVSHLLTVVQQSGGESVTIGSVTGGKGNAGPGKQREIEAECLALIKAGKYSLLLSQTSSFQITGIFSNSRTNAVPDFVDQLELKLKKGDDEITSQSLLIGDLLKIDLSRQQDIAEANGISTSIPGTDNVKDGRKKLISAFKRPDVAIEDNKIRSSSGSPFAVEIRCRADRLGSNFATREPVPGEGG